MKPKEPLLQAISQLRLALMMLQQREKVIDKEPVGLILHELRKQHNRSLILLLEELLGFALQDPDRWEDDPHLRYDAIKNDPPF